MCICAALAIFVGMKPVAVQATLYGITMDDDLIAIDENTAVGTLIGSLTANMYGIGLGDRDGRLFTFDQLHDVVVELDPYTAATINAYDVGLGDLIGEGAISFRSDGLGFLTTDAGVAGEWYAFDIAIF